MQKGWRKMLIANSMRRTTAPLKFPITPNISDYCQWLWWDMWLIPWFSHSYPVNSSSGWEGMYNITMYPLKGWILNRKPVINLAGTSNSSQFMAGYGRREETFIASIRKPKRYQGRIKHFQLFLNLFLRCDLLISNRLNVKLPLRAVWDQSAWWPYDWWWCEIDVMFHILPNISSTSPIATLSTPSL